MKKFPFSVISIVAFSISTLHAVIYTKIITHEKWRTPNATIHIDASKVGMGRMIVAAALLAVFTLSLLRTINDNAGLKLGVQSNGENNNRIPETQTTMCFAMISQFLSLSLLPFLAVKVTSGVPVWMAWAYMFISWGLVASSAIVAFYQKQSSVNLGL